MSRHYKKNSYSPVNRTQSIGSQRAECEIFTETKRLSNRSVREWKGWKCDKCGIVLKDNDEMLRRHLCIGCRAERPGKNHRKLKGRQTYKRFMEKYGKEWRRRRGGLKK